MLRKVLDNKLDTSIIIASFVEHFCTSLYSFLAPMVTTLFFPNYDYIVGLILVYSLHLCSILTKPFGALIFGYIAIKKSAITGLKVSLFISSCITILIAIVPTYSSIGFFSPLILASLIFIKGIFTSGESCIAKLLITENKSYEKSYEASYYYQYSSMLGIISASFCANIIFIFEASFNWFRILFVLSGIVLLFFSIIRWNIKVEKTIDIPQINIKKHKFAVLKVILTSGMSHVTYVIPFVLVNNLAPLIADVKFINMISFNSLLLVFDLLIIPFIGSFVKKYNAEDVMFLSIAIMLLTIPAMILFLRDANIFYIIFFRIWVVFWGVVFMCPQNIYYNNLFKGSSKYLLVGIAGAFGSALIGKASLPVALYLFHINNNMNLVAIYFAIIIALNLCCFSIK